MPVVISFNLMLQRPHDPIATTDKNRHVFDSDHQSLFYVQAKEISADEFKITGRKIVDSKKKRVSICGSYHPHRDNCPSYEVENEEINGDGESGSSATLRSPSNVSMGHQSPSLLIAFLLSWLRPSRVSTEQLHVHAAGMIYDKKSAAGKRYIEATTPTPRVVQSEKATNNYFITRNISGPVASFLSLKIPSNRSPKVKPVECISAPVIIPTIYDHISAPIIIPTIYDHIPDLPTRSFHGSDLDLCLTPDKYLPFSRHCSVEQELFKLEATKSELHKGE